MPYKKNQQVPDYGGMLGSAASTAGGAAGDAISQLMAFLGGQNTAGQQAAGLMGGGFAQGITPNTPYQAAPFGSANAMEQMPSRRTGTPNFSSANAMEQRLGLGIPSAPTGVEAGLENPYGANQDMLAQLTELAMASGAPIDTDAMLADISGGINQAYGAQIGTLRAQNRGARQDTRRGTKEIQRMYKALSRSDRKAGRKEAAQGAKLAADIQATGANAAAESNKSADQLLAQNAATAGALGSPELMASLNATVNNQAQGAANRSIEEASRQATNQQGMSGVNRRYFNESAQNDVLEGTNRSSDLIRDLQDFLQGNRSKIGEVAGQKAQALAAAKNQVLSQAAEQSSDAAQQQFQNMMGVTGLGFDIQKEIEGNKLQQLQMMMEQQQQQGQGPDMSQFLSPEQQRDFNLNQQFPGLSDLYNQTMELPEAGLGYLQQGHGQNLTLDSDAAQRQLATMLPNYEELAQSNPQLIQALLWRLQNTQFGNNKPPY